MSSSDTVHIYRTSPKSLSEDIGKILATSEFRRLDPQRPTLIKINANYDREWPGCNTSKWFLDALLENLRNVGFSDLTVIEGDLKLQPAANTIKATGIDRLLARHGVRFLPIEELPRRSEIPAILRDSQLISTPVLHTHTFAVMSVATKNLFGLLPVYREKYHNNLSHKLLDLAKELRVFTIVDGTVGLQGGSMRMGTPVRTDLLMSGWNPVAVDAIAARVMGFNIDDVPLLRTAKEIGVLENPEVAGDFTNENLPRHEFLFKKSILSKADLWLRGNRITSGWFAHDSLLDRIGNRVRRRYTRYVYARKWKKVAVGDWREYELSEGCRERARL
jgi:uncharacterized protein (DUF362 family)